MLEDQSYEDLLKRISDLENQNRILQNHISHARIDQLPIMAHAINAAGKLVEVSNIWLKKMGYQREEVLGRLSTDFLDETSKMKAQQEALPAFFDKGHVENYPYTLISRDGDCIDVLLSAISLYHEDGTYDRSLAVMVDVTKERQLERALKQSETKFKAIFEGLPQLLALWEVVDDDFILRSVNQATQKFSNYQIQQFLGSSVYDFYKDTPWIIEKIKECYQYKKTVSAEQEYTLRSTGDARVLSFSFTYITDKLVLASCEDITERTFARLALQKSEDFLNRTGEMAQVGGWEVDLHTRRVLWTRTTGRIHEMEGGDPPDLEEAIGYYHPEDQDHVRQCIQRAIENGEPFDFTARLITAKGRERWVHALGQPVFDAGRCVRLSGTFQDITERQQRERALEESEARYTRLAANIPGVVFQNLQNGDDPTDDEFPYISPGIHDLFGITPEEVICDSSAIWALIHLEDVAELTDSIQHAVKTGEDWNHDFRINTTAGETKWVRGMASHERQPDGSIFWDGLLLDITERKLIENQQQVLADIINRSQDFIGVAGSNQGAFFVNPAGQALVGLDGDEAVAGTKIWEYFLPEDLPFFENTILPAVMKDGRWVGEFRFRHFKTGEPVPVLYDIFRTENPETGAITNFATVTRDITERKQAEKDLLRKQRFLDLHNRIVTVFLKHPRTDMESAPLTALDDILRLLDSRFGYFGYIDEAGDLVCPSMTRDVWDQCQVAEKSIVFPRAGWGGLWGRSLLEKRTLVANENLSLPQGHVQLENALAAPIVHHDTLIGQFVVANKKGGYDQEDRELLEAAAAHTAPILFAIKEEARQKTAHEKLEAQLRQAQKMEAVGRLAGGVAHDFNNMLSIVIGHADMILDEMKPGQPFYDDLMEIRQAGARSADLTKQLLAFARRQTVAPKVIDVNKTLDSLLKMLQRLIGEDIDMVWVPGENTWPVKIDPAQIDQILANLCVNARDAIADVGKVTIETGNTVFDEDYCRDHSGFTPGEYTMLAVSDNGCGMDAETLSHLFEPFFTTKELGKGTGLGLATVYGIVKQNNGFINIYSEPGLGTTFRIYLPRHKSKVSSLPEEKPDKPGERGNETILLVEDEPSILRMTTKVLERQGYTVVGALTPGEAVRLATELAGDIHLLVTDVVMPEMNGRDLAKNILALYPGLRCLFMSGYTANVIAHHGVLDEGVNFIQKPFSIGDLTVKVREVLEKY